MAAARAFSTSKRPSDTFKRSRPSQPARTARISQPGPASHGSVGVPVMERRQDTGEGALCRLLRAHASRSVETTVLFDSDRQSRFRVLAALQPRRRGLVQAHTCSPPAVAWPGRVAIHCASAERRPLVGRWTHAGSPLRRPEIMISRSVGCIQERGRRWPC